jgi:hypothetical protein
LRWRCSNPIQNDTAFQQKNLYAPQVVFTGPKDFLEAWMSCQQARQGHSPTPLGRGLSPVRKYFLESTIMSVLCDVHQQVFSIALGHIRTILGFCMCLCSYFKIIFICHSGRFLLEKRILYLIPMKPHKLQLQLQLYHYYYLLSCNNFLATYLLNYYLIIKLT